MKKLFTNAIALLLLLPLYANGQDEEIPTAEAGPVADVVPTAQPSAPAAAGPTTAGPTRSGSRLQTLGELKTGKLGEARVLTCEVHLHGETTFVGTLLELTELEMMTSFGSAKVPLTQVAGVKMASDGNPSTTVVLHNGDSISGALDLETVVLETEWGKAHINGPLVAELMMSQGLTWVAKNTTQGTRWTLAELDAAKNSGAPDAIPSGPRKIELKNVTRNGGPVYYRIDTKEGAKSLEQTRSVTVAVEKFVEYYTGNTWLSIPLSQISARSAIEFRVESGSGTSLAAWTHSIPASDE